MNSEEEKQEPAHQRPSSRMDWKDYVAVTIAALESIFLPVLIIILMLIGITILIVQLAKM